MNIHHNNIKDRHKGILLNRNCRWPNLNCLNTWSYFALLNSADLRGLIIWLLIKKVRNCISIIDSPMVHLFWPPPNTTIILSKQALSLIVALVKNIMFVWTLNSIWWKMGHFFWCLWKMEFRTSVRSSMCSANPVGAVCNHPTACLT